jgi:hypothetical protein
VSAHAWDIARGCLQNSGRLLLAGPPVAWSCRELVSIVLVGQEQHADACSGGRLILTHFLNSTTKLAKLFFGVNRAAERLSAICFLTDCDRDSHVVFLGRHEDCRFPTRAAAFISTYEASLFEVTFCGVAPQSVPTLEIISASDRGPQIVEDRLFTILRDGAWFSCPSRQQLPDRVISGRPRACEVD